MNNNPMCDGVGCQEQNGEVRKLPYGSSGGNMILCRACYELEMAARADNRERGIEEDMPLWEDLEVYDVCW